jgi:hypothetical protein
MRSKRISTNQPRKRHAYHSLLACLLALGSFSCSESDSGSNHVPPFVDAGREASADDGALDGPSSTKDAPAADTRSAEDATSDASIERAPDISRDATVDRSIDATDLDRSIDALDSEPSIDATDADQSIDGPTADASDGGSAADAADADTRDSDAPPLNATCTIDQPCVNGNCQGTSCDQSWLCFPHFAPHPCPLDVIPYCGCDGKTYYFPITCPEVPYEHAGECGDGVNCDPVDVRCKQAEPDCGVGMVASVVRGCYGPCVPIASCRCVYSFECPQRDKYDCNTAEQRCYSLIAP